VFPISSSENRVLALIRTHKRVLLYAIVGGINTGVTIVIFNLLYHLTPLPWAVCNATGYVAGMVTSFVLNKNLAFRDGDASPLVGEMGRFVVVNLLSLGASTLAGSVLVLLGVHASAANLCATGIAAVINYFGYKVFVFRVKGN